MTCRRMRCQRATHIPLGLAQPLPHADDVRQASQHVPVIGIDGRRMNPYEHAVIVDHRLIYVLRMEVIG